MQCLHANEEQDHYFGCAGVEEGYNGLATGPPRMQVADSGYEELKELKAGTIAGSRSSTWKRNDMKVCETSGELVHRRPRR